MPLVPSNTPRPLYGNGGLFHYWANDLVSMVTNSGTPLMEWIPARGVDIENQTVSQLIWRAPAGFTGSQTYVDFMLAQGGIPSECDFAPGGSQFQVVEFQHTMKRVSLKSDAFNYRHTGGLKYHERQPVYTVRGDTENLGQAITNDAEWAIALNAMDLQDHLNWNLVNGDDALAPSMARGTYSGLDSVISTGWVASKTLLGSSALADPMIIPGTGFNTPEKLIKAIKAAVRYQRDRLAARGHRLADDDLAIVMSPAHWAWIADSLAAGGNAYIPPNFTPMINPGQVLENRDRIYRDMKIVVDGVAYQVKLDTHFGKAVPNIGGNVPGVIGDVWILVKRYKGYAILEHLYLDWRKVMAAEAALFKSDKVMVSADGKFRSVKIDENGICWWIGTEMYGMVMSTANVFQTKITDVAVPLDLAGTYEGGNATHPNFYAFGGALGGQGTNLLTGSLTTKA